MTSTASLMINETKQRISFIVKFEKFTGWLKLKMTINNQMPIFCFAICADREGLVWNRFCASQKFQKCKYFIDSMDAILLFTPHKVAGLAGSRNRK